MKALIKSMRDRLRGILSEKEVASTELQTLISSIRAANLTYCSPPKLENLRDAAIRVRQDCIPGDFLEAGVALGGSAILLAKLKPDQAALRLYDVFSMIPPPGPGDGGDAHARYQEIETGVSSGIGGETYYGYRDNLIDIVRANLAQFGLHEGADNVHLVIGLFDDTLHPPGPVALAHIDCDWYEPVRTCIDRIMPMLSPGGVLVFDDYASYSGCTRAVDELMANQLDLERIFLQRSIGLRRKR